MKRAVVQADTHVHLDQCRSLVVQGQTARQFYDWAANLWSQAVKVLPDHVTKFALNSVTNILPHNANLHLWEKKPSATCQLCPKRQTLQHIFIHCTTTLEKRRCNERHDDILLSHYSFASVHLSPGDQITDNSGTARAWVQVPSRCGHHRQPPRHSDLEWRLHSPSGASHPLWRQHGGRHWEEEVKVRRPAGQMFLHQMCYPSHHNRGGFKGVHQWPLLWWFLQPTSSIKAKRAERAWAGGRCKMHPAVAQDFMPKELVKVTECDFYFLLVSIQLLSY